METIYNRIHEIRTRFEVLLRDDDIQRLQDLHKGMPAEQANSAYQLRKTQLQADFAFLAECNLAVKPWMKSK